MSAGGRDARRLARRMDDIQPFHVMSLLGRARAMEAEGRDIVHMEVGEPDFASAPALIQAGCDALQAGHTHYTPAAGLPALREAVSAYYQREHDVAIDPQRILITPGASGALQLVLATLIEPGDKVLMSDPGYPCNRNFVRLFEGRPITLPTDAEHDYQLTAELAQPHLDSSVAAVMAASPSNPTGTTLSQEQISALYRACRAHGSALIVDEIYQGLSYAGKLPTALSVSDEIFVINSFSKYFGMTGWRVGWVVAPSAYVPELEKLAQNLFLAASTPAQHAALAALDPANAAIFEQRRLAFRQRRDYLLPSLRNLGFKIPVTPQGAFYVYADCSELTDDSFRFSERLLDEIGVAITPGLDFGTYRADAHVRFAYTTSLARLVEGVERLAAFLGKPR